MRPSQSATSQWRWGFYTVRGGMDSGDLHPRVVKLEDIWKDFSSGDETLSFPVRRDLGVGPGDNSRRAVAT